MKIRTGIDQPHYQVLDHMWFLLRIQGRVTGDFYYCSLHILLTKCQQALTVLGFLASLQKVTWIIDLICGIFNFL